MTAQRRGLNKERHGVLKLTLGVVALAGFGLGWAGFASSHPNATELEVGDPTTVATPTSLPPTPSGPTVVVPTVTVTASDPPEPEPTRSPRRSRAS